MMEIERPNITIKESADGISADFVVEPLNRGYGITLGNALRRVLLSALPGIAVVGISIDGINHEFSEAEETCILVTFEDIYEAKKARHIDSFIKEKIEEIKIRFPLFIENMGEHIAHMMANRRARAEARQAERLAKREQRKSNKTKKEH